MTARPLVHAIQPPDALEFRNADGSVQRYQLVALRRLARPAPARHREAVWRSACRCCGTPFLVTAPATRRALVHRQAGLFVAHCLDHRRAVTPAAIALDRQLRAEFGSDRS